MMESTAMGRKPAQSGEMLPLLRRHDIRFCFRAGHTQRDVARRTGASPDTVRLVRLEQEVATVDDVAERRARRIGRPSKAAPFAAQVLGWLAEAPELPTQELLRRAKDCGYSGNKTAFYTMVAGVRPPRATPVVRFEGLPGEFSQHDFGHVAVRFVDGRKKRVHFFASRLKFSRSAHLPVSQPVPHELLPAPDEARSDAAAGAARRPCTLNARHLLRPELDLDLRMNDTTTARRFPQSTLSTTRR